MKKDFKKIVTQVLHDNSALEDFKQLQSVVIDNKDAEEVREVIVERINSDKPVSFEELADLLPDNEFLVDAYADIPPGPDYPKYISQIKSDYAKSVAWEKISKLYAQGADAIDIGSNLVKLGEDVLGNAVKQSYVNAGEKAKEVIFELCDSVGKDEKEVLLSLGVATMRENMRKVAPVWPNSDLIIVAGRPGMGKTAFALSEVLDISLMGIPIAFFSLEMSARQLVERLVSMQSGIDNNDIRNHRITEHHINTLTGDRVSKLTGIPLYIDDTPGLTIYELRAKARRLQMKYGTKLVVIDYMQLMEADRESGSRESDISKISRSLKRLAKDLDCPVIALSQLSRAVESRGGDKRPMLSDLRESGAIEQDADMVIFVYRPEYYGITQDEEGNDLRGYGELIISKHRNGPIGSAECRFVKSEARWTDPEWRRERTYDTSHVHNPAEPRSKRMEEMNENFDTDGPF